MRSGNEMSKFMYIVSTTTVFLGLFVCYAGVLTFCVNISATLLIETGAILFLYCLIGAVTTLSDHRSVIQSYVNALIPFEINAIILFHDEEKILLLISAVLVLIISVCYLCCILSYDRERKKTGRVTGYNRLIFRFRKLRTIFAIGMLIFFLPMCVQNLFKGIQKAIAPDTETSTWESEQWTIANNIDTVSNLIQEKWETLSTEEKFDTLQVIANIEANYLGLPYQLDLDMKQLEPKLYANYNNSTRVITINSDYLSTIKAEEMLDVLCHECYHAYQNCLCDAYDSLNAKYKNLLVFYETVVFKEEYENYISGDDGDYLSYYYQKVEITARKYAAETVDEYYYKIAIHQSGN